MTIAAFLLYFLLNFGQPAHCFLGSGSHDSAWCVTSSGEVITDPTFGSK